MTTWAMTLDCRDAPRLARFWAAALGYVPAPPPAGFPSWEDWYAGCDVPDDERADVVSLVDPSGAAPGLTLLAVPEPKSAKNRLHLDLRVGGGRHVPWEQRWPRVLAEVDRLTALGGRVLVQHDVAGRGDHVVLADPEGNELCVV